jgi:hypothetical protein
MGFYCGSSRLKPSSQLIGPVITAREYTTLLASTQRMVIDRSPRESDTYRPWVAEAASASSLLEGLSRRVRRNPADPTGHRMLGIVHLASGNCKPAIRHLEIATNILLARIATKGCLHHTFTARLELALLLPILLPLYLRLGKQGTARRLLSEVLLVW